MTGEHQTTNIYDRLLGEAALLDTHSASWVVHLPPLLREAAAENKMLREELAWCFPRLSRQRYREALRAFLGARGVDDLPTIARDATDA